MLPPLPTTVLVYILKLTIDCILHVVKDCILRILEIFLRGERLYLFRIRYPVSNEIGIKIESIDPKDTIHIVKHYPSYILSFDILEQDKNKDDFMTLYDLISNNTGNVENFLKKKTCIHCNGFMFETESHPGSDCDLNKMRSVMFS